MGRKRNLSCGHFLLSAIGAAILSIAYFPVTVFIPKELHLTADDSPYIGFSHLTPYDGPLPTAYHDWVEISLGPNNFMMVINCTQPTLHGDEAMLYFKAWIADNAKWIETVSHRYGGILFRNFGVRNEFDFDDIVAVFDPNISAEVYVGTAPRKRVDGTKYISTASEIPAPIVVPEHQELSFTPRPPKRLYFFVKEPNLSQGGQTPVTDFRAVWHFMNRTLRDKMVAKQLRYERWYFDKKNRNVDPLKSKSWQDMFETNDRDVAVAMAKEKGFNASWNTRGEMLLTHIMDPHKIHRDTGNVYWSNHFNVLHAPSYSVPYAWSAQIQQSKQTLLLGWFWTLYVQGRHALGYGYGHDITYGDGTPFTWEEMMIIRRTINKHTWHYDHQQGDVVLLDNQKTAHGRQPWYGGPRKVLVAWH